MPSPCSPLPALQSAPRRRLFQTQPSASPAPGSFLSRRPVRGTARPSIQMSPGAVGRCSARLLLRLPCPPRPWVASRSPRSLASARSRSVCERHAFSSVKSNSDLGFSALYFCLSCKTKPLKKTHNNNNSNNNKNVLSSITGSAPTAVLGAVRAALRGSAGKDFSGFRGGGERGRVRSGKRARCILLP